MCQYKLHRTQTVLPGRRNSSASCLALAYGPVSMSTRPSICFQPPCLTSPSTCTRLVDRRCTTVLKGLPLGEVVVVLLVVCTVPGEFLLEEAAKLELAAANRLSRDCRITLGACCAKGKTESSDKARRFWWVIPRVWFSICLSGARTRFHPSDKSSCIKR